MKRFFIILFVGIFWCQFSFAKSMLSINEYISNNSKWAKDPISIAYVFKRCGAVYLYASALTSNKDQIKAFNRASNSSLQFAHQVLVKKKKMSSSKATDIVFGALDKILLNYKNDGEDSYAATGEYTIGNYIGKDLQICKGLVESIN
tara:strand:+ start:73 stop:513 length:441 start_codon:yes stop_codon:yes gene_type:complete